MAISKIKGVKLHRNGQSGARDTIRYAIDKEKTTLQLEDNKKDETNDNGVENVIEYASNKDKTSTEEEILVTGYRCNPATAELEFEIYRQKYLEEKGPEKIKGKPNVAFHLIQSFAYSDKDKVTPQQMNEIGVILAAKLGHYQAVVCTHVDKEHYHNHIVFNAYNMDELGKYHDCKETYQQIRDWNDELAKEFGLSIIEEPSLDKNHSYKEWLAKKEGNSWKEQIRVDIDTTKEFCKSYKELVSMLEKAGYEIVQNKSSVSIKAPGVDRWVSDRRLGIDYTKASLEGYFEIMNNINIDNPQLTSRKEDAIKIRDFNVKNRSRIAPVSRWDSDGNRRGDIELNILYAIKIIKLATGGAITDGQSLYPNNPIFGSQDWKLQTLVDTLSLVKDEDIKNENELVAKLDELGKQISITKAKLTQSDLMLNESNKICDAINVVDSLKDKVKEYNVDELLKVEEASESKIRENLAKTNPASYQQRATLFKLLESNPDLKLAIGSKALTKDEMDEVIEYLNDRTKEKPKDLISFDEWEIKRLTKKYDATVNKINESLKAKFGDKPMTDKTRAAIEKMIIEKNIDVDVNKLTQFDALQLFNYYATKPSTLSPTEANKPSPGQLSALEKFKDNPVINTQLVKEIENLNKKEASSLISALYKEKEPSILREKKMSEGQKKWLSNIIAKNNIQLPYSIDEIDRGKAMEIINIINANNYKGEIFLQNNNPATEKQKNLIEQGLKEGEHLTKNLERLTKSEANNVINYIINGGKKPYIISDKPIEYAEANDILLLKDLAELKGQHIAVSEDTLTKRDVNDAINFLTNRGRSVEFDTDFINDEEIELLKSRVDVTKLAKLPEHITKEEFKEIINYTDNLYKDTNLFKNSPKEHAEPAQVEKLRELTKLNTNEVFYIHEDAMTKQEAQDTINYLMNKGRVPECISGEVNKGLTDKEIVDKIKELPIEQQNDITAYRDALKYLKNRGINTEQQMEKCIEDNMKIVEENAIYKDEMQQVNNDYALNKKIQYNVNLVKNKAFTCGYDVEELLREEEQEKEKEEQDKKSVEEEVVEKMAKAINIDDYVKGDVR